MLSGMADVFIEKPRLQFQKGGAGIVVVSNYLHLQSPQGQIGKESIATSKTTLHNIRRQ